jgi:RimJ/RimL family protein N-acetyltransferase
MEMGIILQPEHANKGLEEELAFASLDYLFAEKPVQKVVSTVGVEHTGAIKLLKTLGMECVERCQDDSGYYYIYELPKKRFDCEPALQAS